MAICPQSYIIDWARDHRVHHKYSETDADPYNAKRGFFFAHVGWLLVRKHPDVKEKGKLIDLSDLYSDPVCAIQKKWVGLFSLQRKRSWIFFVEFVWKSNQESANMWIGPNYFLKTLG